MPNSYIEKISKEKDIPIEDLEVKWEDAKKAVEKQYNIDSENDKYYPLVVSIFKKMANVKRSFKECFDT